MSKTTSIPKVAWETQKLNVAAFLIATNIAELVETYRPPASSSVTFRLSQEPTPEQLASFFNGTGQVSALAYNNALTNLKAAVFEAKRVHSGANHGR